MNTLDPSVDSLLRLAALEKRLEKLAKSVRIQWPISDFRCFEAYKKQQKKAELRDWGQLPSNCLSFENDQFGNAWLFKPDLLKPCRFLTAFRLSSGMTGDRVSLNQAIPQRTLSCRRCKTSVETLAHIVGQCTSNKPQRIRRYGDIRDFITKKLTSGEMAVKVIEEASIATPSGTLKPDLAVISQGRVHVVDITVHHEDKGYLEEGRKSKINKYTPLLPTLANQLQVAPGRVLPVVIGTRGAMSKDSIDNLQDLGIKDRGSYVTLSLMALRSTIEIYHAFLDYKVPGS